MQFGAVYPLYVDKVERKGRTKAELDQAIEWLTGFDEKAVSRHIQAGSTFEQFFADARMNAHTDPHAPEALAVIADTLREAKRLGITAGRLAPRTPDPMMREQ